MYEPVREVVGPKWSLEILRLLSDDSEWVNYMDIESELQTSSDVVSDCLSRLVKYDLIERKRNSQRDVRYSINQRGEEVLHHADEIHSVLS
jgi:DNA-binding HxlR family transcriptional regulator